MTKINHNVQEVSQIYHSYRDAFGLSVDWKNGLMIAALGQIYTLADPSADEIIHEEVHLKQQLAFGHNDIATYSWARRYVEDPAFRLQQEIEAYTAQVNFLKENSNRQDRKWRIKKIAEALSSAMYGNLISYEDALKLFQ